MKKEIFIEPQSGKAFKIKRGQFVTVVDADGGQVADLFAVNADNYNEFLSTGVTIDCNASIKLKIGDSIYSNLYTAMLKITADDTGCHDLLHPCCRPEMYDFFYRNGGGHKNCFDNINDGLALYGVPKFNIIQPLNIFMNTTVDINGNVSVCAPVSKQGDKITFLAEMDLVIAVAACSVKESKCNSGSCSPIKIIIE